MGVRMFRKIKRNPKVGHAPVIPAYAGRSGDREERRPYFLPLFSPHTLAFYSVRLHS